MNWINKDIELEGQNVILRPMREEHIEQLILVGSDPKIWEYVAVVPEANALREYYHELLKFKEAGHHFPFIITNKNGEVIGTTSFGDISQEHRRLEIGWTWYKPELWGKGYNEECKYLLLKYCFEVLKTLRVQLKTNEKNYRSRRAIQRLGCTFEGVWRNHVIRRGYMRNTAMYSMLPEEWEKAKASLKQLYEDKYSGKQKVEQDGQNVLFGEYVFTTDKTKLQPERVHKWLFEKSYWLPGVSYKAVKTAFDHSFCIGVLYNGEQIGYARFVTDYSIFAYLADVYIEEEHRGKGLSKKMMEILLDLPWVKRLKKLMLMTLDAHGLYTKYGFASPTESQRYMEITRKQVP